MCYWDYQFARTPQVRKYLFERLQEEWADTDMKYQELWWCMREESNETEVLKWSHNPASGGDAWHIRTGNLITLVELLNYGNEVCTCYDMYCLYLSLKIFIHKRNHSVSQAPEAQLRRNAKQLRYQETGNKGLPYA